MLNDNELKENYFNWIVCSIFDDENAMLDYFDLLSKLHGIVFMYTLNLDENRIKDAQDLRYTFANIAGYSEAQVCQELDLELPSMLEVMAALIFRVQDSILCGYDIPKITNQDIFLDMLHSLKIDNLKGNLYDDDCKYLYDVVYTLFVHGYTYNGEGGLFTVEHPRDDMRDTEIWYQCMWYLNEKMGGKYL